MHAPELNHGHHCGYTDIVLASARIGITVTSLQELMGQEIQYIAYNYVGA